MGVTTLEIAAAGGTLVGLWVLLLFASWLEDLVFPAEDHDASAGDPVTARWDLPATRDGVLEPNIAAPPAGKAA